MNSIRCLTILFASLLMTACASGIEPDPPGWDGAAWMSRLDDDTPLTCVSIPGAHDAATAGVTAWPQWTRTQELDIEALWNAGVRAFDLRPALVAEYIRQLSAPVGIIMTDFAGVDASKGIRVGGRELVRAVIGNNF